MRLITKNAAVDRFGADEYLKIYRDMIRDSGLPEARFVPEVLGSEFSVALWNKWNRGVGKLNAKMRDEILAAMDDLPPMPISIAEAVTRNADPNAAVWSTLAEGELATTIVLHGDALEEISEPVQREHDGRKSIRLPAQIVDAMHAKKRELGVSWPAFMQMALEALCEQTNGC